MTDPVAAASSGVPAAVSPTVEGSPASKSGFDAGETRMFANLMKGASPISVTVSTPSALGDAAKAMASQLSGTRSLEDMRKSMLESFDFSDPIKNMYVMMDNSMEAQMLFSKMHISTALASAATSLFGTLLKNQQ